MTQAPGLFLDRDGTVNEEVGFLSSPDDLQLIPGSAEAIRQANECGFKVFVITNQSGVGRGFLTEEQLLRIHETLLTRLAGLNAHIDAIYYCPHHPEAVTERYRVACDCRKPGLGMLKKAAEEFGVDLRRSFVVGDRMVDIQSAHNCGATPILVLTGYGHEELELCRERGVEVPHVAPDLRAAMELIKRSVCQDSPAGA